MVVRFLMEFNLITDGVVRFGINLLWTVSSLADDLHILFTLNGWCRPFFLM